jgi:hypothetical protein
MTLTLLPNQAHQFAFFQPIFQVLIGAIEILQARLLTVNQHESSQFPYRQSALRVPIGALLTKITFLLAHWRESSRHFA